MPRVVCTIFIVLLPAVCFSSAFVFPDLIQKQTQFENTSVKNDPVKNIKMDSLWDRIFGKKTPTPIPTPRPIPTPTPVPSSQFRKHELLINIDQQSELAYTWIVSKGNINFSVKPAGILKVEKKRDRTVLKITGIQNGEADILMKDSAGNLIDTCHVAVKMDSPNLFSDHELAVITGEKISLSYRWSSSLEDVQFTVKPVGIIKAVKKRDSTTLEITALNPGNAEVLMKDAEGNILDSCKVTVKPKPTSTPLPVYSVYFANHSLSVNKGAKVTLGNYWSRSMDDIQFSVRPPGTIKVVKKRNSLTLEVTGLYLGTAEILMKDKYGNILDTCSVTVRTAPASTSVPARVPTRVPTRVSTATPYRITWKCEDSTSFDNNAYNDNKCTSSLGEVRFVSDSEAIKLDPGYIPGKKGHPYYNSK